MVGPRFVGATTLTIAHRLRPTLSFGLSAQVSTTRVAFESVSRGGGLACGVRLDDATVMCRGFEDYGQVSGAPAIRDVLGVSSGGLDRCGADRSGGVFCWGNDYWGQAFPDSIRGVAAGAAHPYAVNGDDVLSCWGDVVGLVDLPENILFASVAVGTTYSCGRRH